MPRGEQEAADRAELKAPGAAPATADVNQRNEFQDFVTQSVGRALPMFGYDLFTGVPTTFAPVDRVPVTPDYMIGPGDEIVLRGWGQVDIDYRAVVDRNGAINIPKVGTFNVAGLRYRDLEGHLKTSIGRIFRNFELNVTLGALRSIQVFVVGNARRPGSYTVSSLSTLVNTLFASGGPSVSGSMRHIQLKRSDKVVTEFDLYDLLLKGDKSKDLALLSGDVIYIPPIGRLVAISGSVNRPAIYETRGKTTLEDLIALAGGLTTTAAGQKVSVERIFERKVRKVDEFALDQRGLARELGDGDLIRVFALSAKFDNAVTLRGNVAAPARYPWREGLRVKDVIPDRDALIVPDYWIKRNLAVGSVIGVPGGDPRTLPGGDLDARRTLPGGVADQSRLRTEVKRLLPEINWDYAVIERLNPDDLTTMLIPFNLGKAVLGGDPEQNVVLRPGDVITVFSQDDIQVPVARRTKYVRVEGEFRVAGLYQTQPGETLRQLVARVGGVTPDAYFFGVEFTRERTRIEQQKQLDAMLDRMNQELERSAATKVRAALTPEDAANVKTQADSQRALIERLRALKATGRIVLEIPPGTSSMGDLPDIVLDDNDRIFVPSRPSTVNVLGAVYTQGSFSYRPERRLDEYLRLAGGPTRDADESSIYLLRADGSVISNRQSGWLSGGWLSGGFSGTRLLPDDTIVVPERFERFSWTKELKDWTQIFSQFGIGIAAIKVLKGF
jgi:protein involved in polysaccharide export with SLBB domain